MFIVSIVLHIYVYIEITELVFDEIQSFFFQFRNHSQNIDKIALKAHLKNLRKRNDEVQ